MKKPAGPDDLRSAKINSENDGGRRLGSGLGPRLRLCLRVRLVLLIP
jgi:hypothetical protein